MPSASFPLQIAPNYGVAVIMSHWTSVTEWERCFLWRESELSLQESTPWTTSWRPEIKHSSEPMGQRFVHRNYEGKIILFHVITALLAKNTSWQLQGRNKNMTQTSSSSSLSFSTLFMSACWNRHTLAICSFRNVDEVGGQEASFVLSGCKEGWRREEGGGLTWMTTKYLLNSCQRSWSALALGHPCPALPARSTATISGKATTQLLSFIMGYQKATKELFIFIMT